MKWNLKINWLKNKRIPSKFTNKKKTANSYSYIFFLYIQGILITSAASVVEGVCQNGVLMMIHG